MQDRAHREKHDPSGRLQRACSRLHLVVHLLGAVEHVDHDAQRAPQVLGGLGLAGPGGARGGATHGQVEGLSQGDVASSQGNGLLLMAEVKGDTVRTMHGWRRQNHTVNTICVSNNYIGMDMLVYIYSDFNTQQLY